MLHKLRPHSAYDVVALLALFVALGGTSYAVTQLPANSVGTRELKANAVTSPKIKNGTIIGADINKSKLGKVPLAAHADNAAKLGGLPASAYGPRAYAYVDENGALDRTKTKGVIDVRPACNASPCTSPPPAAAADDYCFKLGFAPKSVIATPADLLRYTDDEADHIYAKLPADPFGDIHGGCAPGYLGAEVFVTNSREPYHRGFFVVFE